MPRWVNDTIVPVIREDGWGHQIRSYIEDRGVVKDLRTGVVRPFRQTLDGDLDDLLREALAFRVFQWGRGWEEDMVRHVPRKPNRAIHRHA